MAVCPWWLSIIIGCVMLAYLFVEYNRMFKLVAEHKIVVRKDTTAEEEMFEKLDHLLNAMRDSSQTLYLALINQSLEN
jgi:hypothetical protein